MTLAFILMCSVVCLSLLFFIGLYTSAVRHANALDDLVDELEERIDAYETEIKQLNKDIESLKTIPNQINWKDVKFK